LQELIVKLRRHEPVPTGRDLLTDFVTKEWLPSVRLNVSERTALGYETIMRLHVLPLLGKKQLKTLTSADLERVYAAMAAKGLTGNTRLHAHRVIHMALTEAVRRGKLAANPASRERMRAPRKENFTIEPPTPEEVGRLIREAEGTRIGTLVKLLVYTGMRLGEALGLRWMDIDLDGGFLHIRQTRKQGIADHYGQPKTERSRRMVDMVPQLVEALRDHRREQLQFTLDHGLVPPQDLVFTVMRRTGIHGMSHEQASRTWMEVRRRAGLPRVRIHDLRHAAATFMVAAGVPITEVSAILGHAQVSTTVNIYAHAMPGKRKAAVSEIEKAVSGRRLASSA
jgi:integrase